LTRTSRSRDDVSLKQLHRLIFCKPCTDILGVNLVEGMSHPSKLRKLLLKLVHSWSLSCSCLILSNHFSSWSCLVIPDHCRQVVNDVGYSRLNEIQRNLRKRPQVLKGVPDSLGQRVVIGVNSSNRCNQLVVLSLEVIAVGFKAANDALQLVNRGLLFLDLRS